MDRMVARDSRPRWIHRELTTPTRRAQSVTGMSFTWTIKGVGSADCRIADDQSEARVHVSYISTAPESFLNGVTRIVLGARHIKVHFEGEPGSPRWIFDRYGHYVDI